MALFPILVACGVMVLSYLLTVSYMRTRDGVQPSYIGLLIAVTTMGCFVAAFYILRRFGFDLLHPPQDIIWLVLGIMWLVSAVWTVYQRQTSGTVLMDLGRAPMLILWIGSAVLLGASAIGLAINGSRTQAFAVGTQSAWSFVMARGRIEVRDRGVILSAANGRLPWNRIAGCVATDYNSVRLNLNSGLQRSVDVRLPADRRDEFIQLVNARRGVKIGPHSLNS
jgi:hypothetical protein